MTLAEFILDHEVETGDARANVLYALYQRGGGPYLSPETFAIELQMAGHERIRKASGNVSLGLSLVSRAVREVRAQAESDAIQARYLEAIAKWEADEAARAAVELAEAEAKAKAAEERAEAGRWDRETFQAVADHAAGLHHEIALPLREWDGDARQWYVVGERSSCSAPRCDPLTRALVAAGAVSFHVFETDPADRSQSRCRSSRPRWQPYHGRVPAIEARTALPVVRRCDGYDGCDGFLELSRTRCMYGWVHTYTVVREK